MTKCNYADKYKGLWKPSCDNGKGCGTCHTKYKKKQNKKYRFFYHYRKNDGGMTVHFRGKCIPVRDVQCLAECETKRNKKQPLLVMQGFCKSVKVSKGKAIIQ